MTAIGWTSAQKHPEYVLTNNGQNIAKMFNTRMTSGRYNYPLHLYVTTADTSGPAARRAKQNDTVEKKI